MYLCLKSGELKALLKTTLLAIFLLATLFYNIRFSYLLAFHSLNNESFTELYCVNKDKPELECNGQCSLMKAGEKTASETKPGKLENFQKNITLFAYDIIGEALPLVLPHPLYDRPEYQNLYRYCYSGSFLHPPGLIS